ncbi:MAG TPA: peptidase MA domain-containing protein [Chloroflexi bacterium]|nr:peptidase MA domain-containing protein [Chloroflexota bacterium]
MIRRSALIIISVLLLLLSPSFVAADAGIVVTASDVDINFPSQAVFTLDAESSADIVDVRLYYQVDKMSYAEIVSEGWADFTPATRIEANWVWDMRRASLPPGAGVTYWWMVEDADGSRFETSPEIMHFNDDRFSWQSLTGITPQGSELTLSWYEGSDSFAQKLMSVCQEGLVRLTEEIGAYPERPINIYIYASTSDLREAMIFPQEWTGGVAFTAFSTIAIGIPPSEIDWGKRALVHELTHLVVHQVTFSPYGQLPIWLDEGLAMYNEGELDLAYSSRLEKAILDDKLISVRSLCSPFSAEREKALLSYAQSYSLVEYLLNNYGRDRMLDLLNLLKEGATYDKALTEVYGFDIDGLDVNWRETLAPHAVIANEAQQYHPALITVLAAMAAVLVLWGALTLKKRGLGGGRLNKPHQRR